MSTLLIAMTALFAADAHAWNPDDCGIYGDINNDGEVDITDVQCSNLLQFDTDHDCYGYDDGTLECANLDCSDWVYESDAIDTAIVVRLVLGATLPGDHTGDPELDGDGILNVCQQDDDTGR
jgi:hypothetical protein